VPELPEVETVRAGLQRHVTGARVEQVEVLHPRPMRRDPQGPAGLTRLVGRLIGPARRRGKFFWLPLDSGDALLGHLGMSGQMLVRPPEAPDERHLRVRFRLAAPVAPDLLVSGPAPVTRPLELRFVDQRMFGALLYSRGGADLPPEIGHIARDPLDPRFDQAALVRRMQRRTAGVKHLLLDQGMVSGIGNIYADEALWRARLHGDRPAHRIRARDLHALVEEVRAVLTDALAEGGTSFDALYVDVNGQSGYFDRSLRVYGREGRPCTRCGAPIRRMAFANRSSYFCPRCQPPPRARPAPAPRRARIDPGPSR
jgi:formamidopyrimidine-DNA glycosylase